MCEDLEDQLVGALEQGDEARRGCSMDDGPPSIVSLQGAHLTCSQSVGCSEADVNCLASVFWSTLLQKGLTDRGRPLSLNGLGRYLLYQIIGEEMGVFPTSSKLSGYWWFYFRLPSPYGRTHGTEWLAPQGLESRISHCIVHSPHCFLMLLD